VPAVLLLALLAAAPVLRAADPVIANAYARAVLTLDGPWRTIVDPYDNGYLDYRLQPYDAKEHPTGGYFLDRAPSSPSDLVEYDFDSSAQLRVPGDWNSQSERLLYYEGTVWYRRRFDRPGGAPGRRQFLYFGAANYEAEVYLNGSKLGRHIGGFTPFQFEVTGKLREKANSLVVRVNNQRRPEAVPTVNTDWWNYGGLTRDVLLLDLPATFVSDYLVQLKPGTTDRLAGYVQLDGAASAVPVRVEVPELGVAADALTDATGRAAFEAALPGASLWTPENPRRYQVEVSAAGDRVAEKIGFRTIATRGRELLLNGQPIFLRGVCLHEENPLRGARATSPEEARLLLGWAKDLGCNYLRLAHYPHNEYLARVADEMGLLLWEEIPVYWTIHWDDPATFANARDQLDGLVGRDHNRASVVIWSVGNETPVSPARTSFMSRLIARARELDPTRLVAAAMEVRTDPNDPYRKIVEDPLADSTDIVSFNQYVGWYTGLPDDCPKVSWVVNYDKPVVISEFGGDALQGYHATRLTRFSEEFQADLYRQTLPMLEKIPQLRGMSPWILCDFRSPRRPLPGFQDGWNRKGLIGSNGERKEAFLVLQEYYRAKAREAGVPFAGK
jgi:beta-glucuronidase